MSASTSETTLPMDGEGARSRDLERLAHALEDDEEQNRKSAAPHASLAHSEKSKEHDPYAVALEPAEDPKNLPEWRKWLVVVIISTGTLCATSASSMAAFAEEGVSSTFHVGSEVTILGVSFFVLGLGIGPLLIGPLSEVYGRNWIYRISYGLFFAFSWAVAFAPHIAVYLIFRFLTGFSSSAFLSVAGGSISDLFDNHKIATPMAIYTGSPFIGPVLGPLIAGFINQNTSWRWTFRILIIWTFMVWTMLLFLVPETYVPYLLKTKAAKMRKQTGDERYWAPLDRRPHSLARSLALSCYVPFELLIVDQMALLLDIWSALLLGILYLTFQAFPIVFGEVHHFEQEFVGMTFLGIGVGMTVGLLCQPLFNRHLRNVAAKNGGQAPPEARLVPGMIGGVMVPASLYWLAFTTYGNVHWIAPIIASVPFGMGILFIFISVFTYTVTAYRPIAASAMAANAFVRTTSAAAFPLFAGQMYHRLGTVGATALLAGLTTVAAPLPFVFYHIGARLRAKSKFGAA
ncbi:MFS general substrate transporter [Phanerochaete sordida]|uniref:MFS general substrate transporter n=1 Tax=Phanerochaete sordida TaxID=48140 RepID=A0A9P3FY28_9APHY|nr:MFS general substrate transporter [Phanerochaete sordida]